MREIICVLRGRENGSNIDTNFVLYESSCLIIQNLVTKGFKYLFPVEKEDAPPRCSDCGCEYESVYDGEDEPASIKYSCGKLILRDYPGAIYSFCSKK